MKKKIIIAIIALFVVVGSITAISVHNYNEEHWGERLLKQSEKLRESADTYASSGADLNNIISEIRSGDMEQAKSDYRKYARERGVKLKHLTESELDDLRAKLEDAELKADELDEKLLEADYGTLKYKYLNWKYGKVLDKVTEYQVQITYNEIDW